MKLIPERLRRPPRDPEGTMTLVEHLEELRSRLFIALGAIGLGSVIGWFLYGPVLRLLQNPYCDTIENLPAGNRPPTGCKFVFTGVLEPVVIKLKVVVFLGLFIALPIVLWQLWAFVVPGLTRRERRLAVPFVASSVAVLRATNTDGSIVLLVPSSNPTKAARALASRFSVPSCNCASA